MRILLDTNVVVDVLQQREPWHKDGEKIFLAAAMKQLTACITAKQAADIHHLTSVPVLTPADLVHLLEKTENI